MSQTIVVACPNCETRFSAPAGQFQPKGRQVRCSQCQHSWFHAAPSSDTLDAATRSIKPAPMKPATPKPKPTPPPLTPPDAPRKKGMGGVLWLVALVLGLAIGAYHFRDPIGKAAPQAAPLLDRYAGAVDRTAQRVVRAIKGGDALTWERVHYDVKEYGDLQHLLIEADLLNPSDEAQPAPTVQVQLLDADRAPLQTAVIAPENGAQTIEAGTSARYFLRIPNPPAGFETVQVMIEGEAE